MLFWTTMKLTNAWKWMRNACTDFLAFYSTNLLNLFLNSARFFKCLAIAINEWLRNLNILLSSLYTSAQWHLLCNVTGYHTLFYRHILLTLQFANEYICRKLFVNIWMNQTCSVSLRMYTFFPLFIKFSNYILS